MGRNFVYVVGTCDTKQSELRYVAEAVRAAGAPAFLVDVGTAGSGNADICAASVAEHHPQGKSAVLGHKDRGTALDAMGLALVRFMQSRSDVAGVIGLGGSGNTGLVTRAMRALPVGLPKVMVSTIASGDVGPYVGPTDIAMIYSITDIAGLNRINRTVLANAANAIAGMVLRPVVSEVSAKPEIGLTQFGVTTPCVDQVRAALEAQFECMSFHATGIGGQTMEKLVDSGFLGGVIDITTTEVADLIVGGVLPATADRFGAMIRTRVPLVISLGALDVINFWGEESIPQKFNGRRFHKHNPEVTLMRTSAEESAAIGRWVAERLNQCDGPVRVLIPEGGLSALDAPGKPFWDPKANNALFDELEGNLRTTPSKQLIRVSSHINSHEFARAVAENFREIRSN